MGRPDWDDYFMKITRLVSQRATCLRRQVGALLVKDHRILTTGYNGAPSGLRHCLDIGCLREKENVPSGQRHELCRALHAEQNAILQAALHGVSVKGAVLYCTHHPCSLCAKMLVNAGVTKIIYEKGYPDPLASEILVEARLERLQLLAGEGEEG